MADLPVLVDGIAELRDDGIIEVPLSFKELQASALIWKINHELLHDTGLALSYKDAGDGNVKLTILISDDGKWEFSPLSMNADRSAKYDAWYESLGVPTTEQSDTDPAQ